MISRRRLLALSSGAALGVLGGCSADGEPSPALSSPTGTSSPSPSASPSPAGSPSPSASRSAASPSPSPSPTADPAPELAGTIADDIAVPWGLVFTAAGDALVGERDSGRVLRVTAAGRKTSLGRVDGVAAPTGLGEGGLLGLAFAPGDEDTLFAYITTDSDNRVVRVSLDGGRVGSPKAVLTDIPTSVHHHGGRLLFDRDGMLLVATGDAEQAQLAQDRGSLAGKILRIRPDGRAAPGNPFDNRTWSYGHRNVEGLAFDAAGRLWASEFGDKKADELNLIRKGRNYGWPDVEGRSGDSDSVNPKVTWATDDCSPAGLAITRSTAFLGALQGECLFAVPLQGTDAGEPTAYFRGDHGRIRGVYPAPDGSLWVTTSNTDGRRDPGRNDDKILRVTL